MLRVARCGTRLRMIRGCRRLRFPNSDAGDPCAIRRWWQLTRCLIVDMARQIFRRWIERIERRKLIEIFVIERSDDRSDYLFQAHEIIEQPGGIQLLSRKHDANLVIVT